MAAIRSSSVAFLASAAGEGITGQVFGVRGREVFLFSQPRPVARVVSEAGDWDSESLARAVTEEFSGRFTNLTTDLEAFNTEPFI